MQEAIALRKSGDYVEAKAKIEKALKIEQSELAYKELGNYYLEYEHNLDAAEDNYLHSLSINAKYTNALHNMGLVNLKRYEASTNDDGYGEESYLKAAKQWFDKALATDSTFPLTFAEMGKYYFYRDDYQNALDMLKKSISLGGNEAYCRNIMGQVYFKGLDKPELALDNFQISYAIFPGDPDLLYHISMTHLKLDNMVEAEKYFDKYIALLHEMNAPDNVISKAREEKSRLFPG